MGLLEDVASHLDASSTALTAGTTLFVHSLPELGPTSLPTYCLQLEAAGGSSRTYGAKMPIGISPTMVVLARTTAPSESDYVDPRRALGTAWAIWETLEQVANTTIPAGSTSGSFVYAFSADVEPTYVGRDDRRRAVFEQRFAADYRPSTSGY